MSYCEIIAFTDGRPGESLELRNAWGGMARICGPLYDQFCKRPDKPYDSWLSDMDDGRLWKLSHDGRLPQSHRAVLVAMFDRAIVRQEHFARFAADLRDFSAAYPASGCVDHLDDWARFVEAHPAAEAIGFYLTSVSENLWHTWDEEKETSVPYDLHVDTKHFEVYDYLALGGAA